jgi:DNA replication and repair protein RecF
VYLECLWLTDYRSYEQAEFCPAPGGITLITGGNGAGKTNLVEAVAYLATLRSMRGSPPGAMIRSEAERAVVRAQVRRESRSIRVEAELHAVGRDRVQVNGQPLRRTRDLLGAIQVTVFSPDDLSLVKGGPQLRRQYLDDLLVGLHPRHEATISEVERVIKQRNALLKSMGSSWRSRDPGHGDARFTLDVWDTKLAAAGEELAAARAALVEDLQSPVQTGYRGISAGAPGLVALRYHRSWEGELLTALIAARDEDMRRGVTSCGPHRDELDLMVGGFSARSHASQGEQRSLALALRLGGHQLVTDRVDSAPVLLLDDVFSELDARRSESLLACLPDGQAILTTAGAVPAGADVHARFRVEDGKVLPESLGAGSGYGRSPDPGPEARP